MSTWLVVLIIAAIGVGLAALAYVARAPQPPRDTLTALIEAEAHAWAIWQAAKGAHEYGDYEGHSIQRMREEDAAYKEARYLKAKAAVDAARKEAGR